MVSEKIDGTNASILIVPFRQGYELNLPVTTVADGWALVAGSRTRWITPENDNYGFAAWVKTNAYELVKLGEGHHFGEWWGKGINRGYNLTERKFSLFNVHRWNDAAIRPSIVSVVPMLYEGPFRTDEVDNQLNLLRRNGSYAAFGYMKPEGVVVYHTGGGFMFKKTIQGDEAGKSYESHVKAEPKPPRIKDPSKGGRRIAQIEINFPDRRKPRENREVRTINT